ncbi:alcohol dehydrogenase catalytic domain-containing protein [Streptomyces reniochalinae]|uniref:alcohol dehydrogenase catalytic domain-containing protein n=1 Tax=Streptomyces reniochalinae TaxID=2250578 RepID=UPI001FEB2DFC|nr:alcohol dehydrogenase catalytic domain-containing protein [Streptomyces reniochalinae]
MAAAHPQAVARKGAAGPAQVVDDLDVRAPGPGEVLVGIRAAGLCHSDLSVIDGTIPFPRPVVLGHEGAGVVEAVGEGVRHVTPGDHVALSTIANCGVCPECARGRPTMCRSAIGRPEKPFCRDGRPLHNFAATSAFAERTVVKAVQATPIPRDIPLTCAALIGCGVLTGVGAVLNRAKVGQGESVVVLGVGGIGLNVLQGARIAGAAPIVAVDANPAKQEVARRFGATHFVTASPGADGAAAARGGADASVSTTPGAADTEAAVREILPDGAAHTFECVGSTALVRQAIDLLDRHGQAVLLGMPEADAEATFLPASMFLDKSVLGCRYGSSRPPRDIALYADLYREGRLLLDELVTEVYPIEDFGRAAHDAHQGRVARAVLTF